MDLTKPIKKAMTIQMNIFARDKKNRVYKLFFHSEKDLKSSTNIFMDYSDRLEVGDIVEKKVEEALREDLGIKKIVQMEVIDEGELDQLEDTQFAELLDDYLDKKIELALEVEYKPELETNLGDDLHASWIELNADNEDKD